MLGVRLPRVQIYEIALWCYGCMGLFACRELAAAFHSEYMSLPPVSPRLCRFACAISVWLVTVEIHNAAPQSEPGDPLKTIREIKLSSGDPSRSSSVDLEATVTHSTPEGFSGRELVVEDDTGGVWVTPKGSGTVNQPPGTRVHILGRGAPGKFSPIVEAEVITAIEPGAALEASPVRIEDLLSGTHDSRYVSITERIQAVRQVEFNGTAWTLLALGARSQRLHAMIPAPLGAWAEGWIGSVARVTGVCAHYFTPTGQILNAQLRVSSPEQVTIVEPALALSSIPLVPIRDLLTFQPTIRFEHRIRTQGVIAVQQTDQSLVLIDGDSSTRIWTSDAVPHSPGALVEACGFAKPGASAPEIEDATITVIGTGQRGQARRATFTEAMAMGGRLIVVRGRLYAIEPMADRVRLLLESGGNAWTATVSKALHELPKGVAAEAVIDVTGISRVAMGPEQAFGSYPAFLSFEIAARDVSDLEIVVPTSWWTPARVRVATAALTVSSLALAVLWIRQRRRIQRLARAREELSSARDQLAQRVETRTDQLQEQLIVQHRSQSEVAAVMAERARVARDLHDSLGQTLASAKWRVETLSVGSLAADQHPAGNQLSAVFGLLDSCQKELQRSVWNLRNPDLDRGHLSETLREAVRLLFDQTGIAAVFDVSGTLQPLPLPIETNILRFTQEALANILKHAGAKTVKVILCYTSSDLRLSVQDDGRGFDAPGRASAPSVKGHFGLNDMKERAESIGGEFEISSNPGAGTLVSLAILLPDANTTTLDSTPRPVEVHPLIAQ